MVAFDRLSHPTEMQSGQAIAEAILICNAAPQIRLAGNRLVRPDKSVALEGAVTHSLVAITAVQHRVDSGDWMAAIATDGLFDSQRESFALVTAPLTTGKHTIEVLAFNAAGNNTVEKVTVDIP